MNPLLHQRLRRCWPWPGRMRSGLAAGCKSYQCWGLPWRGEADSDEELTLKLLPLKGKVVYDIGANFGIFSLFFSRRVGTAGAVIAFEPQPDNYRQMRRNLRVNRAGNVRTLPLGLGAVAQQRPAIEMAGRGGTASVAIPELNDARYQSAGVLELKPLDEVVSAQALPPPDFMKIDVEGAELEVVKGAERILRNFRPQLFLELHGTGPFDKADSAERLCRRLLDYGYDMVHVETAARVRLGTFVPGAGHLLCSVPA